MKAKLLTFWGKIPDPTQHAILAIVGYELLQLLDGLQTVLPGQIQNLTGDPATQALVLGLLGILVRFGHNRVAPS